MFRKRRNKHRQAVTLIEAVLFVAVALGLMIGGMVFYRQATVARQTQETVRLVQALAVESAALFERSDVSGTIDLNDVLLASGAVPSKYVVWSSTFGEYLIHSPWGSQVYVSGGTYTVSGSVVVPDYSATSIRIDLANTPPNVCTRIAAFNADGRGNFIRLPVRSVKVGLNTFYSEDFADHVNTHLPLIAEPAHGWGLPQPVAGVECTANDGPISVSIYVDLQRT